MTKRNENRPGYKKKKLIEEHLQWKNVALGKLGEWVGGGTPSKSNPEYWQQATIPWASSQDIKDIKLIDTIKKITEKAVRESATNFVPEKSIIIVVRSGILRHSLPIAKTIFPVAINQDLKALIPDSQDYWVDYLVYVLGFNEKGILKTCSKVGTTVESIEFENLKKYQVLIPPLPEQKKIAEILSAWDRAIRQTCRLIEAKKRLKKGLMQQLLTGRRRFPEFGPSVKRIKAVFYDYPSDWAHPKIGEIAKEILQKNQDNRKYTVLSCTKYDGFVNSLEYFGKKVYSDDTSNYKVIKKDQFGFPSNHIEEGSIGLLEHEPVGIVSPIYIVFQTDSKNVYPPYLYELLKTETYKHIFKSNTNSSVDRRGSLRWNEFSNIRVPLPSLKEQHRIHDVLATCDKEISLLEKKEAALKKQKQGLMQKLLTGEVRVKL